MEQQTLFTDNLKPRFFGRNITEADTPRLKGNLKKVFNALLEIGWHGNEELFKSTGLYCCDRYRRYISEGRIAGYIIEKKNFGNGVFKYRLVKL